MSLPAKTLFAVLVAHLSFRLLETPINRLKSRFVSERHPMLHASTAPAPARELPPSAPAGTGAQPPHPPLEPDQPGR